MEQTPADSCNCPREFVPYIRHPVIVVDAKSITSFKNRLDDAWKNHEMKYSVRVIQGD